MAITIIVAIVAVAVALLIAVPLTCKVAVNNKAKMMLKLLAQQKTEQEAS